jgi:hypothetical protein
MRLYGEGRQPPKSNFGTTAGFGESQVEHAKTKEFG